MDFLLCAHRNKAAYHRYFEKTIEQNSEPETITVDRRSANLAALEALNAGRLTPVRLPPFENTDLAVRQLGLSIRILVASPALAARYLVPSSIESVKE